MPVKTSDLLNISTSFNGGHLIARNLYTRLSEDFEIAIQLSDLEKLTTNDVNNADVPTLYQKDGILYYGVTNLIVGTLKPKKSV